MERMWNNASNKKEHSPLKSIWKLYVEPYMNMNKDCKEI